MPGPYSRQTLVRCSGAFQLLVGGPVDPTTVVFWIRLPDSTITTYATPDARIVKDSTGNYHTDFFATQSGTHSYRFEGDGVVQVGGEQRFVVLVSDILQ